jgi:hypothetical protein
LVEAQSLGNLKTHREYGVERSGGLLKDVSNFASPSLAEEGIGAGEQVGSILPENFSLKSAGGGRWGQAGQGKGGGGFA